MAEKHIGPGDLIGKVTDIHAHVGMSIKAYANIEFPYGQTVEGLHYRQVANGVDFTTAFPVGPALYFDISTLVREGRAVAADEPLSKAPYALENRMLFTEVFEYCPECADRFMPFVCIDPGRAIDGQLAALNQLAEEYPIYGIKCSPVACQSKVTDLHSIGQPLLEFAASRDLPLLFHVATDPNEGYSNVSDTLDLVERHPELRICLAHCCGFDRRSLERADALPNAWVDTAALKIQVQLVHEDSPLMPPPRERFESDYDDHIAVMRDLTAAFPRTIVWGSDSPWYSFISRRMQAPGVYSEFRLKATYEDETAALDGLPPEARDRACSFNAIAFLFGTDARTSGEKAG